MVNLTSSMWSHLMSNTCCNRDGPTFKSLKTKVVLYFYQNQVTLFQRVTFTGLSCSLVTKALKQKKASSIDSVGCQVRAKATKTVDVRAHDTTGRKQLDKKRQKNQLAAYQELVVMANQKMEILLLFNYSAVPHSEDFFTKYFHKIFKRLKPY